MIRSFFSFMMFFGVLLTAKIILATPLTFGSSIVLFILMPVFAIMLAAFFSITGAIKNLFD